VQLSDNLLIAIGGALAAVILLVLIVRIISMRSRTLRRTSSGGPGSMRFICVGCAQQFTHTKRTVAAWESGTRRLFCNSCHKEWLRSRPPQTSQPSGSFTQGGRASQARSMSQASNGAFGRTRPRTTYTSGESRGGCLGISVFFVLLPVVILFVATNA
jgi:hypothetical protein